MSNQNKPTGFSPVQYVNGAPWNGQVRIYSVAVSQANPILIGDPVASSGSSDVYGVQGVTLATAGSAVRGVVVAGGGIFPAGNPLPGGPYISPNNLALLTVPASNTVVQYVAVVDDPMVMFEIQEIGTGTFFVAADVGLNANFTLGTAGVAPFSGALLDNANKGTTAALNCRIWGLAQRTDNTFGQYAKYLVTLNNHELHAAVAGV